MNTHSSQGDARTDRHGAGSVTNTPIPGLRATKQRTAVVTMLDENDEFRSAQEIHEQLRERGEGIGLATVYRTLQSLSEAAEIDMLRTDSGEAVYRRCSEHHHHHLLCRGCGYTVEIEGPSVERWAEQVAAVNGFVETGHTVEITGLCRDCQHGAGA